MLLLLFPVALFGSDDFQFPSAGHTGSVPSLRPGSDVEGFSSGSIFIEEVKGHVFVDRPDRTGSRFLAKAGITVPEATILDVHPRSYCKLRLANGALLMIYENTQISITKFVIETGHQRPDFKEVAQFRAEPAMSNTRIDLYAGGFVGIVKPLKETSSFSVHTPLGVGTIRSGNFHGYFTVRSGGIREFDFSVGDGTGEVLPTGSADFLGVPAGQQASIIGRKSDFIGWELTDLKVDPLTPEAVRFFQEKLNLAVNREEAAQPKDSSLK